MSELDRELIGCFCDEARDNLVEWESLCLSLKPGVASESFNKLFRIAHNIKGASRSVGLMALGDFVHEIEDMITALREGTVSFTEAHGAVLLKAQSTLLVWVDTLPKDLSFTPATADLVTESKALCSRTRQPTTQEVLESPEPIKIEERATLVQQPTQAPSKTKVDETVRVSAGRLDDLIQMIGELAIHQATTLHARTLPIEDRERVLTNALYLSRKLTKETYERALALRMQPVQSLLQRMERTIKDLARDLGKQVTVETSGGEVELDKTVLERIVDPLVHIVRNAIDHGIETPERRATSNKAPEGHITLRALQDSEGVSLIIEDDGQGLHRKKLLQKAIEKGLVQQDAKLTDDEILHLIFLPGFSTAQAVTNVSGRGVGMDVVIQAVKALQGSVTISSTEGHGSRFRITLPTTLSIMEALTVELGGERYAIPVSTVEEVVNLSANRPNLDSTMLQIRGQVLPYRSMHELLPHKIQGSAPPQSRAALVAKVGNQRVAFGVDQILGQQQIVVRQLTGDLANLFGVAGGTILGSGEPGLILDLSSLTQRHLEQVLQKTNAQGAT